jgi:hypothetical protein
MARMTLYYAGLNKCLDGPPVVEIRGEIPGRILETTLGNQQLVRVIQSTRFLTFILLRDPQIVLNHLWLTVNGVKPFQ